MTPEEPKIIKSQYLSIVGLKGNQSNLQEHAEIIERRWPEIKNITIPFFCQVVWSTNHEINQYDIFQGFVVNTVEEVPEGLEVYKLTHQKFISLEHSGDTPSLVKYLEMIHWEWLPKSDYEFSEDDFSQIQFSKSQVRQEDLALPIEERIFTWEVWFPIK